MARDVRGLQGGPMRFAAKMIFDYRVDRDHRKRHTCESRIVVLPARSAADALRKANARGAKEQLDYINEAGDRVSILFVGLADLIQLDAVCEEDEVWYSIFNTSDPSNLVRRRDELSVFRPSAKSIGSAVRFAPRTPRKGRSKRRP
jgi:hypothetical protein